jgi:SAM-dependent methyltransferase
LSWEARLEAPGARGWHVAALRRAGRLAFPPGEYVGQESFVSAGEIRALEAAIGIGPGDRVLDLCCGAGGISLYLIEQTGCHLLGVDLSRAAIRLARDRAARRGLGDRATFLVAEATRPPFTRAFSVVLLFETMLAIEDKLDLLHAIRRVIEPGGRVGLTLEAGDPLTPDERGSMPDGDRTWLLPEAAFRALAGAAGFRVRRVEDRTAAHAGRATGLAAAFRSERAGIEGALGADGYEHLLAGHHCWAHWLATGRVRKLMLALEAAD